MVFSKDDRILIQQIHLFKGYGARKLVKEFPEKNWQVRSVQRLLNKLRETGTSDRQPGSGRPRTVRTQENINAVGDLVLSQENAPGTHRTVRQTARETGISQTSIVRIIHDDLQLKCFKKKRAQQLTEANRLSRAERSQQLLDKFSEHQVGFIFFTDEKVFTVAPPVNPQNDRVYAPATNKKRDINAGRLLRTRPTFSKSVMVSVAISKLGCTNLIFVEPGTKINGQYYRDVLLMREMLPAIRRIAGDVFVFQQDNAPAHRARETVELLHRETPMFISPDMWPANSPDLNPVDYRIWGVMQERVYRAQIRDEGELRQRLVETWTEFQQSVVDEAIEQWRERLRACVCTGGGHFEHLL